MRAALIILSVFLALPVAAGELSTYRSGQIYAATPAPSANICEMQCTGDAQCRSWNFLPPIHMGQTGRCELNATSGPVMSHPYAQSGAALIAQPYNNGRLIQAGTRTTQIGRPAPAAPPVIVRQIRAAPRYVPPRPASEARRQSPQHSIISQVSAPAPLLAGPPPVMMQRLAGPLNQPASPQPQRQIPPQSLPLAPVYGQGAAPQQPKPIAPMARPVQPQAAFQAPQMQAEPFNPAPAMDRLYGSLYDDAAPAQQRMPLYSERPVNDPDRPVVTTIAVPTSSVTVQPMPLAGGMER